MVTPLSRRERQPSLGVVYLARGAEGLRAFERFAESYRRNPAGIDHELIILYKGFEQASELTKAREIVRDLPHLSIELDDTSFDIGAYLAAAARVDFDYLCFLNTFSELSAPAWLRTLFQYIASEEVGIVGAMGSYESRYNTSYAVLKMIWLCNVGKIPYDSAIDRYFQFSTEHHCEKWRRKTPRHPVFSFISNSRLYRWMIDRWIDNRILRWSRANPEDADWFRFPRFPNPHIRSNGFIVRRGLLLSNHPSPISTKNDAYEFESGKDGLTAQILRRGLKALIVNRHARAFDVPQWPQSDTFRLGHQSSLLLEDNQTRSFIGMPRGSRETHARFAWGDYLGRAPADFPNLRVDFRKGHLVAHHASPSHIGTLPVDPDGADARSAPSF